SPLSASLDPLSWVAVRCARLLQAWATADRTGIDKTGEGRFVETYPAAALRAWSIEIGGSYKTDSDAANGFRQALIDQLTEELDGLVAISDEFRQAGGKKGGD